MDLSTAIDQAASIRQGEELNIEALNDYLSAHLPDDKGIIQIRQFPSGYSNLTYLIETSDSAFVLRRPPFGANIKSAHDMEREFKALSLLKSVYPKVPAPVLYCEDVSIIGAPFYLMEKVSGVILRNRPPKGLLLTPELMKGISEAAIDNLVELHQLDVDKTGLIQLGKPEGFVQRQVSGWIQRYYKAETDVLSDMNFLAEWMTENLPPESTTPAFIHNDYKYDNLVLRPENLTEIIAVLDWEMATVGDPLMDLGTMLAYWAEPDDDPALQQFSLTSMPGNLDREQILHRYAQKSGANIDGFVFYYAFACFKIGVIGQQIYARYKKGFTNDARFADLIHLIKACAQNGFHAVKYNRISRFQ